MKRRILKCRACNLYTLRRTCSKCGQSTVNPKPARYSPEDKWGKYRRIYFQGRKL